MPTEDGLTPAELVFVRVLADAVIEDTVAEGLTASTPDSSATDAEHVAHVEAACR